MTQQQNVSDTLNLAADLIEERGWAHGGGWNDDITSPLCLEGGILAASGISGDEWEDELYACPSYVAVMGYLKSDTRWGFFKKYAYDWNDVPTRTATEVVEVLRATALIESARERESAQVSA